MSQEELSFPTDSNLNQLYEDKLCQLQHLRNELELSKKQQEDKIGGHDYNLNQEAMFQNLEAAWNQTTFSTLWANSELN